MLLKVTRKQAHIANGSNRSLRLKQMSGVSGEDARDREQQREVEEWGKSPTILAEMRSLEGTGRMRSQATENITWCDVTSQPLRSRGLLDAAPYLLGRHAGHRCGATCACSHHYASFPNWRRGEVRAKDQIVYAVMVSRGNRLVNRANGDNMSWKSPPPPRNVRPSGALSPAGTVAAVPSHLHQSA